MIISVIAAAGFVYLQQHSYHQRSQCLFTGQPDWRQMPICHSIYIDRKQKTKALLYIYIILVTFIGLHHLDHLRSSHYVNEPSGSVNNRESAKTGRWSVRNWQGMRPRRRAVTSSHMNTNVFKVRRASPRPAAHQRPDNVWLIASRYRLSALEGHSKQIMNSLIRLTIWYIIIS